MSTSVINYFHVQLIDFMQCNIFMLTRNLSRFHVNVISLYLNRGKPHINIHKSHDNIIMLHVDYSISHVDIIKFALMGQKRSTTHREC